MSFQIIEILESQPEKILARVRHENHQVTVTIPNKKAEDIIVGRPFLAETDHDRILNWKIVSDFDDAKSAIWQEKDGIHLMGRIHSIIDFGDGRTIIDVYLQNGPEFFTVNSEMIGNEILENDVGLEITVSNLYLYPDDK